MDKIAGLVFMYAPEYALTACARFPELAAFSLTYCDSTAVYCPSIVAAPDSTLLGSVFEACAGLQVDQPGSAIDSYLLKLGGILDQKAQATRDLQRRLALFSQKLKAEENMFKGVPRRT